MAEHEDVCQRLEHLEEEKTSLQRALAMVKNQVRR